MLFNSFEFLLLFLPLTLLVYYRLSNVRLALAWLSVASLVFYGYWNPVYLGLILASVLANFGLGRLIAGARGRRQYWLTALSIALNLGVLGYYKYANFFVREAAALTGRDWSIDAIVLPLAISFFTFQQIAYLVDAKQGKVPPHGLLEYLLFVTFFPQLIAGPIVHPGDVLPQFRDLENQRRAMGLLSVGLSIFIIGLFKKVAIADQLALYAIPVFDAARAGTTLSFAEAWGGTLAYTLQLYFDFSGYSDMAIGLGKMFGVTLPVNFASPYRARSIIDFWRSWHITLSNFLRDYLYIPLGGNRFGTFARYRNLFLTMFLGGLWHGAGWTFAAWGGLHGIYLIVNNLWRRTPVHARFAGRRAYNGAAWVLTLLCVIVGWVFFRAESFEAAISMLASMSGLNGVVLPNFLEPLLGRLLGASAFGGLFPNIVEPNVPLGWWSIFPLLLVTGAWALFAPNVFEIFHGHLTAGFNARVPYRPSPILWRPGKAWAAACGLMLAYCLMSLGSPSEFLYFQF